MQTTSITHDSVYDTLVQRKAPTAGESLWLQDRGLPYRYWDLDPYRQVKHLAAAGFTFNQILDLVDLPDDEVADELEKIPELVPEIVRLNVEGLTVIQIATELNVKRPAVYYHLNDLGLEPNRDRAREITVSKQRKVEQLADMGMSYREIADRCGLTYAQVRAAVRRAR